MYLGLIHEISFLSFIFHFPFNILLVQCECVVFFFIFTLYASCLFVWCKSHLIVKNAIVFLSSNLDVVFFWSWNLDVLVSHSWILDDVFFFWKNVLGSRCRHLMVSVSQPCCILVPKSWCRCLLVLESLFYDILILEFQFNPMIYVPSWPCFTCIGEKGKSGKIMSWRLYQLSKFISNVCIGKLES